MTLTNVLLLWSDSPPAVDAIPEYSAAEERDDARHWRTVNVTGQQYRIDMKVIEPYKKVLSHGGTLTFHLTD